MVSHFWTESFSGMAWSAAMVVLGFVLVSVSVLSRLWAAPINRAVKLHIVLAFLNVIGAGTMGVLLETRQIDKMIASYVGENKLFERQFLDGIIEVELSPQGTMAERMRAGGAGIAAFFTPTGYGTPLTEGKETREFDGRWYVLETALHADVSLVKAWKGDEEGNLVYRMTARNFNPQMAEAGRVTVAEVEEIVAPGEIDPHLVHTPGIYVDRVVVGENQDKVIERRKTR